MHIVRPQLNGWAVPLTLVIQVKWVCACAMWRMGLGLGSKVYGQLEGVDSGFGIVGVSSLDLHPGEQP